MFNKVDNFLEEQLGKTKLPEETEEQKSIKIIFNSGDNGKIRLPINYDRFNQENGYFVDWGDGY